MRLAAILDHYHDALEAKYGSMLSPAHKHTIDDTISKCRTPEAAQLLVQCTECGHAEWRPHSCGHRSCPQCQNHETSLWLDRQQAKLLPVDYFMATFTLPYELRFLAWNKQSLVYNLLFACASSTLKDFGLNPKNLGVQIGMTAVLHTHNRRLDFTLMFMSWCREEVWIRPGNNGKRKEPSTCSMNSHCPGCFVPDSGNH